MAAYVLSPNSKRQLDAIANAGAPHAAGANAGGAAVLSSVGGSSSDDTYGSVHRAAQPAQHSAGTTAAFSVRQPEWMERPMLVERVAVLSEDECRHAWQRYDGASAATVEAVVIDDVLHAMVGVSGELLVFVTPSSPSPSPYSIAVAPCVGLSTKHILQRILPICVQYVAVRAFVERRTRYEYGRVNHALCAALNQLLREYTMLVAQMEAQLLAGVLTLQRLWLYLQPCLRTMQTMYMLIESISSGAAAAAVAAPAAGTAEVQGADFGAALLNRLHDVCQRLYGDEHARRVCLLLLERASAPYVEMLDAWVHRGEIDDPYGEFVVRENYSLDKEKLRTDYNDSYWELRYTLRRDPYVPFFLRDTCERVLATGKYLNVLRQCGVAMAGATAADDAAPAPAPALRFSIDGHYYTAIVDSAYVLSSRMLLTHLLDKEQLLLRLRSIKHYFLLDQGDFLMTFMDLAGEHLRKKASEISQSKLNSLLGLCVRTSSTRTDPFGEDIECELLPYTLLSQLLRIIHVKEAPLHLPAVTLAEANINGYEAFTFNYRVRWPLSLVLSRKALTKYQLLFRHLFLCRNVEQQLNNSWLQLQAVRSLQVGLLSHANRIRQSMLHFLHNLQYYIVFEVVEPAWTRLEGRLRAADTVDDVLAAHTDFLDTCLQQCMLTDPALVKTLTKIMSICVLFASYSEQFSRSLEVDLERTVAAEKLAVEQASGGAAHVGAAEEAQMRYRIQQISSELARKAMHEKGYARTMAKFEKNFYTFMKMLIDSVRIASTTEATYSMLHFLTRLDFNGFVSGAIAQIAQKS